MNDEIKSREEMLELIASVHGKLDKYLHQCSFSARDFAFYLDIILSLEDSLVYQEYPKAKELSWMLRVFHGENLALADRVVQSECVMPEVKQLAEHVKWISSAFSLPASQNLESMLKELVCERKVVWKGNVYFFVDLRYALQAATHRINANQNPIEMDTNMEITVINDLEQFQEEDYNVRTHAGDNFEINYLTDILHTQLNSKGCTVSDVRDIVQNLDDIRAVGFLAYHPNGVKISVMVDYMQEMLEGFGDGDDIYDLSALPEVFYERLDGIAHQVGACCLEVGEHGLANAAKLIRNVNNAEGMAEEMRDGERCRVFIYEGASYIVAPEGEVDRIIASWCA